MPKNIVIMEKQENMATGVMLVLTKFFHIVVAVTVRSYCNCCDAVLCMKHNFCRKNCLIELFVLELRIQFLK